MSVFITSNYFFFFLLTILSLLYKPNFLTFFTDPTPKCGSCILLNTTYYYEYTRIETECDSNVVSFFNLRRRWTVLILTKSAIRHGRPQRRAGGGAGETPP